MDEIHANLTRDARFPGFQFHKFKKASSFDIDVSNYVHKQKGTLNTNLKKKRCVEIICNSRYVLQCSDNRECSANNGNVLVQKSIDKKKEDQNCEEYFKWYYSNLVVVFCCEPWKRRPRNHHWRIRNLVFGYRFDSCPSVGGGTLTVWSFSL